MRGFFDIKEIICDMMILERRGNMKEQLQAIANEALAKLEHVEDMKSLEEIRILFLGKKGKLTSILKGMGSFCRGETCRRTDG